MSNFKFSMLFFVIFFLFSGCYSQKSEVKKLNRSYTVYNSSCVENKVDDIIKAAMNVDVILFGESHGNKVAHQLEMKILEHLHKKRTGNIVLSLEMFERDVQVVMNEYLTGLISERHFINSSRAWGNYRRDYRPMIEFSRKNKIPVIASNAPRRYVNLVARKGKDSLIKLSKTEKKWIAPLPYLNQNVDYIKKIKELNKLILKKHSKVSGKPMKIKGVDPDAQHVWDITMAYSIIEQLKKHNRALIYHINGKFHSEDNMGIPDSLRYYKKNIKILTITTISKMNKKILLKDICKKGDFVIITDSF
ncbi:MAG: ChaN family lipoprotein [Desulfobacterales bacterium]|nr:ChaN family lipoprotein [Desulfobacterales bacterium]